jgi:glutamyl-tRNA synthetase
MAHLPLIMSPAGGKLSKRNAEELGIPVNVRDYVKGFYEPEALVNFLAFLGWNPGDDREMMSLEQLVSEFSLERVSKAGAVFNMKKLLWYNEQYFRSRTPEQLLSSLKDWIVRHKDGLDDAFLKAFISNTDAQNAAVIGIIADRVSGIHEIAENIQYFYVAPAGFKPEDVAKAWKPGSGELVAAYKELISGMNPFEAVPLHDALHSLAAEKGVGLGKLMQPLRLALTGKTFGPDLFEFMARIGKEESVARLERALEEIGA